MEAGCDEQPTNRKVRFSLNLRVRPVYFEDPRSWALPDAMGQVEPQSSCSRPWRAPVPAEAVEQVVAEVARLSVDEEAKNEKTQSIPSEKEENMLADTQSAELNNAKRAKGWKRKTRVELGEQQSSNIPGTLNTGLVRSREEINDEVEEMEPVNKKASQQALILGDAENTGAFIETNAGLQSEPNLVGYSGKDAVDSLKDSGKETSGTKGEMAATGLGATGKLPGASESSRQEP